MPIKLSSMIVILESSGS